MSYFRFILGNANRPSDTRTLDILCKDQHHAALLSIDMGATGFYKLFDSF